MFDARRRFFSGRVQHSGSVSYQNRQRILKFQIVSQKRTIVTPTTIVIFDFAFSGTNVIASFGNSATSEIIVFAKRRIGIPSFQTLFDVNPGQTFEGRVSAVQPFGFFVFLMMLILNFVASYAFYAQKGNVIPQQTLHFQQD
jgi:hypothetical protein